MKSLNMHLLGFYTVPDPVPEKWTKELTIQGKQPILFVANDKIWTFLSKNSNLIKVLSLWAWQLPNT